MPLTHIYISADKPDDYVKKVSQSLHEALTESFAVPQKDCFQIINRLTNEQRIYDKVQYSFTLPANYDIETIRNRVTENGHKLNGFPQLSKLGCLRSDIFSRETIR